jgi:undecaprenyl-diphosphatase
MRFLQALDEGTLYWMTNHHRPLVTAFMVDVTALGGYTVLTLLVVFSLGLLVALRRYQTASFVFGAVIGGILVVTGIKNLVGRERPDVPAPVLAQLESYSFPSGHSMLSAVTYLTLALLLAGRVKSRRVQAYLIVWSLLLTFFVGISRLYLGVHYLTDVLAGWIGGLAWALFFRWMEDHWVRWREKALARDVDVADQEPG